METSATEEFNECDKACLDLLQKKSNTDFWLSLLENRKGLPTKKKSITKSKIITALMELCHD